MLDQGNVTRVDFSFAVPRVFTFDALPALVNLARVVPTLGKEYCAGVEDEVLRLAEKGHNILLTGFPGTGKTKQVNIVNKLLHVVGRRVAVTSTTGIINSQTVHRFCGLKDGRFTNQDLVNLLNSEIHKKQKENLLSVNTIIIGKLVYQYICEINQM